MLYIPEIWKIVQFRFNYQTIIRTVNKFMSMYLIISILLSLFYLSHGIAMPQPGPGISLNQVMSAQNLYLLPKIGRDQSNGKPGQGVIILSL